MSNVPVPEHLKHELGKIIIEAALHDDKFDALKADPIGMIRGIATDDNDEPVIKVPDDLQLEVLQNDGKKEFLIVPDRVMVQKILDDVANGDGYDFPSGYFNAPDDDREKYDYRVGDYVLAQCG